MKKYILLLLPLLSFALELKINVENIDIKRGGDIYIGIYNSENDFLKKEYRGQIFRVSKSIKADFNLSKGIYSIAIFHDENRDGELNKNFIGIPKEGYGFSNNVIFPSFNNSKIDLSKSTNIDIEMRY